MKIKDIKPALSGYIREAQLLLKETPVPGEKAIHDVRVLMKRSRAVLKLADNQLDKKWFTSNINALRETGRLLAGQRDTSVQRRILRDLRKDNPSLFRKLAENERITMMLRKPGRQDENAGKTAEMVKLASDILHKTGYRIRFEPMNRLDARLLFLELDRTYSEVIRLYLTCRFNPKPEKIHEFRKRAKDFLYQVAFFRPLNPNVVKLVEKRFEVLTQALGKYCDSKQLIADLGYKYSGSAEMTSMEGLIVILKGMQDKYLVKVWAVSKKIFKPYCKLPDLIGISDLASQEGDLKTGNYMPEA